MHSIGTLHWLLQAQQVEALLLKSPRTLDSTISRPVYGLCGLIRCWHTQQIVLSARVVWADQVFLGGSVQDLRFILRLEQPAADCSCFVLGSKFKDWSRLVRRRCLCKTTDLTAQSLACKACSLRDRPLANQQAGDAVLVLGVVSLCSCASTAGRSTPPAEAEATT